MQTHPYRYIHLLIGLKMNISEPADTTSQLLLRNLRDVFGEGNADRRRVAIEEIFTEDCVACLPIGRYVGREALSEVADMLRTGHPTYVYTPHGAAWVVQDGGYIAWGSGPIAERPRYTGIDFITVRDGRIATLYVFLHSAPA
jgi:hypothetical protein